MQIDRLNHLQFPADSKSPLDEVTRASAQRSQDPPVLPISSAVVSIQSPASEAPDATEADAQSPAAPVQLYAPTRRTAGAATATDHAAQETERKQQAYQQALERASATPARLAVDKDGVVVTRPSTPSQAAAPDFMTVAVQTLRDHANEMERQKNLQRASEDASSWGNSAVRGLQHLGSKLRLFA